MHFTFAVKQQNLDLLEAKFWDVSNPSSPDWGDFLTQKAIATMVASKAEHMAAVTQWL